MRKTINKVKIEGKIYKHDLAVKVTGPTSKAPGTEYIGGTIDVATDDEGLNIVTVYYTYVTAMTKANAVNKTYTALKQIIDNGKTIVLDGIDNATLVSCDTSLAINDFFTERAKTDSNPDGLVSAKRCEGGFVTIVPKLRKEDERNKFQCDVLINDIREVEANEERGITDDYIIIKGAAFNFRNDLLPIEFSVKKPDGIKYFTSLDLPFFTKVEGNVESRTVIVKSASDDEEVAFGTPTVKEFERSVREWVVTTANKPYELGDEQNGITADEIKAMKAARESHLAEVKANQEAYQAAKAATPAPTSAPTGGAAAGAFNF